jgi:sugar lactone lactonase YvrE
VRTAAVDADGRLWISLTEPFTYVYDPDGNKTRTMQFRGAGVLSPVSFFFAANGRLLVTPGCYEYDVR